MPEPALNIAWEHSRRRLKEPFMFYWAAVFLVIALVAGLVGFGAIASVSFSFAKVIFVVALVLFVLSALFGARNRTYR